MNSAKAMRSMGNWPFASGRYRHGGLAMAAGMQSSSGMIAGMGKRAWWIAASVAVAILVALPFAWRAFKDYRAEDLAGQSREQLEAGQLAAALEAARAAHALDPDNLAIERILARALNAADPLAAPGRWQAIYEKTRDEADLLAWFDACWLLGDADALATVAARLARDFPASPEATFRRARHALFAGRVEAGVALAREAAETEGAGADIWFFYVQTSQRSADSTTRAAGIERLRSLAEASDENGLRAARLLVRATALTPGERLAAADQLAAHPLAERSDKLLEIALRRGGAEQDVDALLAEAKALFALENPGEWVELGRWLNQQGRSAELAELVDFEQARQRRDLFLVWLDAMAVAGRWDELAAVLDRPSLPIEPFVQTLFTARVQWEQGKERRGDLTWNRAVLDAREDASRLWYMYDYAIKLDRAMQARAVLERLSQLPLERREAFNQLVRLDQREGAVVALRDVLVRMAREYPDDPNVANDLAYADLLLGGDPAVAEQTARRLLDESPRPFLANLMTLALARYQAGNADAALEVLYPLPIDWTEARPGWRAVYAAILDATGHPRESQDVMAGVDSNDLLPPERELLRAARQRGAE